MAKYRVIYADPAWKIKAGRSLNDYKVVEGKQVWNSDTNKSRDLAYNTMSVEEIKNLPIKDFAEDDAHLYIWVTNSHLPFIFEIIKAWGFKYSTTLVWAKNRMGGG